MQKAHYFFQKKIIYLFILTVFILLSIFYFFKKSDINDNNLSTIHAEYRDIKESVLAPATLEALLDVDVGSQVSGQIEKIFVDNGQKVTKGDLLVTIDKKIKENELQKAYAQKDLIESEIEAKKSHLDKLYKDLKRFEKLKKHNATSEQSYDNLKYEYAIENANLKGLKSKLVQATIALSDAKTNISYTTIKAPIDGYVYAIWVKEGQTVNANQNTPTLVRLASLEQLELKARIAESDVIRINNGIDAKFKILGLIDREFNAKLLRIDLASEKNTYEENKNLNDKDGVYYIAHFLVDNKENLLRLDMSAYINIIVDKRDNALSIPITALVEDNINKGFVFVNNDGSKDKRELTLGLRDESFVEVISGLSLDDEIILTVKERKPHGR